MEGYNQQYLKWKADGSVVANEKGSINSLAQFFGVEKPF